MMKLGIIGAGQHFKKNILPIFSRKICNTWDLKIIHGRSILPELSTSGFSTTSSIEEVLSADIDAIYISLPNALHEKIIEKSLHNDKHVLCEKSLLIPGSSNLNCLKQKKRVKEAFMYKHHPLFHLVKKQLQNKSVTDVSFSFCIPHLNKADIRYNPSLGGGSLLDVGSYVISAVNQIYPKSKLISLDIDANGYDVDTSGIAKYYCSEYDQKILLRWGFGKPYENYVKWKYNGCNFHTSRFFSKDISCSSRINKLDENFNLINFIETDIVNHFTKMFDSFSEDISKSNFDNIDEIKQYNELNNIINYSPKYFTFLK